MSVVKSALFHLILGGSVVFACAAGAASPNAAAPAVSPVIAELERKAAAGDTKAQADLGARYGRGDGVPKDVAKAIALLSSAADKNDPDAEFFLGTAYSNGTGVPRNESQAIMLYEKAANQGHADSEYLLAEAIAFGKAGLSSNWEAAIPLLWDSATKNCWPAAKLLAVAYQDGKGVDKNPRAAAYWFRRTYSLGPDMHLLYSLRSLIDQGLVEWQEGDPGQPLGAPPAEDKTAAPANQ